MGSAKMAVCFTCRERIRLRGVMKDRFVLVLIIAILSSTGIVKAQQTKAIPRIGYLSIGSKLGPRSNAFFQGLRELGYVEGQNILIEHRGDPQRRRERLPQLAQELVQLHVDIIVALDPPSAKAAIAATQTIPIVMRSTNDPVAIGFVASLARPGGNVTGLYSETGELIGKRLEVLKELMPEISRVGILWDPDFPTAVENYRDTEKAAAALRLRVQSLEARQSQDFPIVFGSAVKGQSQAVFTLRNPLIVKERKRIAELARQSRLPVISDDREFVEAGGLLSYGTNLAELYRRAAYYVDRILRGTKPADLPVEQPTQFELVINLKTANQIGLTIPQSVLYRVDRVIK
jgi:putative ABC transport system substrate-binding protein